MFSRLSTSMILCIINHYQSITSPTTINNIQILNKLADEVNECCTISSTLIHCIEELPFTTYSCNDIDSTQSSHLTNHILLELDHPPSLTVISISHHTLININDALMRAKELDILRCRVLSLKLGCKIIMVCADGTNLSVWSIHSLFHVPT